VTYYPLEKLHQLREGYQRVFRVEGRELLLIHSDDQSYLLENRCPHADAPLTFATVSGDIIRCPMHGIEFSLKTGAPHRSGCKQGLSKLMPAYEGQTIGVYLKS
jgi:3-phenylpropionate/trans-cinnamate dioxygenase ferredoxin subunit